MRLQARVWRVIYNMRCLKDRVTGEELILQEIEGAEESISPYSRKRFPNRRTHGMNGRKEDSKEEFPEQVVSSNRQSGHHEV